MSPPPRPPRTLAPVVPVALGGLRVLVAEDEFFIADDLVRLLVARGAQVLGPAATVEAVRALADEGPQFAILDINLRGQKVYPVADLLAARGVPFVFVTGYEPDEIPDRFADVPCWDKPIDTALLADS